MTGRKKLSNYEWELCFHGHQPSVFFPVPCRTAQLMHSSMQWQMKPLRVLQSLQKLQYHKNWCFAPIIEKYPAHLPNTKMSWFWRELQKGLDLKQVVPLLAWISVTKTGIPACVLIIRSWQKKIKETFTLLLVKVVTSMLKEAFISFRFVVVARSRWMYFNLQVPLSSYIYIRIEQ